MRARATARTALLVLATGVGLVLSSAPTSLGGVGAQNGRIAFYRFDTQVDQIFSVTANGSRRIRLTDSQRTNWDPDWSPDGSEIVFVRAAARRNTTKLMVMDANGHDPTTVLRDREIADPDWSPDGTQIAFCEQRGRPRWRVIVAGADGSNPTRVGPAWACYPAWSPDGSQIAFALYDQNFDSDIWVMDADGGGLIQLTSDGRSTWPTWSPDGSQIAFIRDRRTGHNKELFVMDADGTNRTRLTDTDRVELSPDWSPDGTEILYCRTSRRDPFSPCDLWTVTPDGATRTRLTETPGIDEFSPSWQPVFP